MNYAFRDPPPYKHQVKALKKILGVRAPSGAFLGGGLLMPMRSGKSRVAIDYASALRIKTGHPKRVLIVCGRRIIPVWRQQIQRWTPLPHRCFSWDEVEEDNDTPKGITWLIVNRERTYDRERYKTDDGYGFQMVDAQYLYDFRPELIIIDEGHRLGDPTTIANRKVFRLKKQLQAKGIHAPVVFLTGTPFHRKIFYAFGQFKLLDESIFGTNWGAFKSTYGLYGGYDNRTLLKYINVRQFRKKIEPYVFAMAHVPASPPVHHVVPVDLGEHTRKAYRELERDAYLTITGDCRGKNTGIETPLIITKLRKLAQVSSGYIRDEDRRVHRLGTDLRESLAEYLEELIESEKKVVIFCEERPQLLDAAKAAKSAGYKTLMYHGGTSDSDGERRIEAFQTRHGAWAFVAQTSTGSEGIDLSAASVTCFYGIPQKLVDYDQASARMRKFRDKRKLTYVYFVPRGSVVEANYMALRSGLDLADFILKHPDLLHHEEVG